MIVCVLVFNFSRPVSASEGAQAKPLYHCELALYQGKDREKILLEGARKEGQVTFYTSNTWMADPVAQEFGKKYPLSRPMSGAAIPKHC